MRFLMSTSKKPLVDSPFFESTTRRIIPISNWLVSGLITDYNQVINLIISPLGGLTTSRFTRHLRFLPGSSAVKHSLGLPTPAHPASEQYWPNFMWVACSRSMLFKHVSPPPKRTYNTKKMYLSLGCGAELALNLVLQAQSSDAIMVLHQQVRLFGDSSPY